jgi:HD-GYP domain-containing protein (c-di-GMP phosphodiesterase class II)
MEPINIFTLVIILLGACIMVANVVFYIIFMFRMRDVISGGIKRDKVLMTIGLLLLIFFLVGYIYVAIAADPILLTGLILFFGSLFVSVVILLLSRLIKTSKTRSLEIAQVLVSVIDSRDKTMQGHSLHVKNLITLLYKYLPRHIKAEYSLISFEFAALLHDIGILNVPEEILSKLGDLSEEEMEVMKTHPQIGVRLLRPINSFDYVSDWILYHHERINGEGYYFKTGDSIPYPSKMLAIADHYSLLILGKKKSYEEAMEEIKQGAGTMFDEELVNIFLSIPKEEVDSCMPKIIKY